VTTLKILAVDPSMRNFGMAKFDLPLDTLELKLLKLRLVQTETLAGKTVRKNSDDLRRAQEIAGAFFDEVDDCDFVFAEIPSGAQSARAAYGFGMQVGIIGACTRPVIQVMPLETKRASVGSKTATKDEMIEWAVRTFPSDQWLRARNKPTGALVKDNEHLADACGIAVAGLLTDEFRRSLVMFRKAA
jgi:hypothetical protein